MKREGKWISGKCWWNEIGYSENQRENPKIPTLPTTIDLQVIPRLELETPVRTDERFNRSYTGTVICLFTLQNY